MSLPPSDMTYTRSTHRPSSAHCPAHNGKAGTIVDESMPTWVAPHLRWEVSYDRASVDRFVAEVEAERSRLLAEIDATRAQVEQVQAAAARQATAQAELAKRFLSVQRELESIESEHRARLHAVRTSAAGAAAQLLSAAGDEVEAMRAVAAQVHGPGPGQSGADDPAGGGVAR